MRMSQLLFCCALMIVVTSLAGCGSRDRTDYGALAVGIGQQINKGSAE